MSDARFRVVFEGEVADGAAVEDVKKKIGAIFRLETGQVDRLFAGGKVEIKRNAPLAVCEKTRAAFEKAGAVCVIEPEPGSAGETAPLADDAAEPESTDAAAPPPAPPELKACSVCGNQFAADDLIRYQDALICAECKPAFVQRLKEGAAVSGSALSGKYGSIDSAVSGRYDFKIKGVLSEAWSLVNGSKLTIVGGMVVMYIAVFVVTLLLGMLMGVVVPMIAGSGTPQGGGSLVMAVSVGIQLIMQLVTMAISYPFMAGLFMIGIRRSANLPTSFSMIFDYFNRIIPLLIVNILYFILVTIGFLLLVIPGIYLALAYMLAMPLMVEKNMSPWQALETSRKTISKKWFKFFGFFLLLWLIVMVSVIPFGIGLIWTMPLTFMAIGVLYRDVFGIEDAR